MHSSVRQWYRLIAAPGINYEVDENEEATERLYEILTRQQLRR
jgi:hypothetical protein